MNFLRIGIILLTMTVVMGVTGQVLAQEDFTFPTEHSKTVEDSRPDPLAFLDTDLQSMLKTADSAYQLGKYTIAVNAFENYLRFNIKDGEAIYNLACCYGLLGEHKMAAKTLLRACNAGMDDIEHIRQDTDFDKVKDQPVFKAALDSIAKLCAAKNAGLGKEGYLPGSVLLRYMVHLPEGYTPTKKYPLVVGLHGWGSNYKDFARLWKGFGAPEFIYATLQAPYPFEMGSETGYSWTAELPGDVLHGRSMDLTEQYIIQAVDSLTRLYAVKETFLMGFSQGAGMALQTGIKYPSHFRGIVACAGRLDLDWVGEEALTAANKLHILIVHGTEDKRVEYRSSTATVELLESKGFWVEFFSFKGGHTVAPEVTKRIAEWVNE